MISVKDALDIELANMEEIGVNLNEVDFSYATLETRDDIMELIDSRVWKLVSHYALFYLARDRPLPRKCLDFLRPEEVGMMDQIAEAINTCRWRLIPREIHPDQTKLEEF